VSRHLHAKIRPRWKPLEAPGASKTARRLIPRILQFNGGVNSRHRSGGTLTNHSHTAWAHRTGFHAPNMRALRAAVAISQHQTVGIS